jgi:hypothetical protein
VLVQQIDTTAMTADGLDLKVAAAASAARTWQAAARNARGNAHPSAKRSPAHSPFRAWPRR